MRYVLPSLRSCCRSVLVARRHERLVTVITRQHHFSTHCSSLQQLAVINKGVLPHPRPHHLSGASRSASLYTQSDFVTRVASRSASIYTQSDFVTRVAGKAAEIALLSDNLQLRSGAQRLCNLVEEIEELGKMMEEPELKASATEDQTRCSAEFTRELLRLTAAEEPAGLLCEIVQGAGGQESMLFADQLLQMYEGVAERLCWRLELTEKTISHLGGLSYASFNLFGPRVWSLMKFEGGVHRVQRIPTTEKRGRVHTSTVAVSVQPIPSEVAVQLSPKDVRVDTFRSSGAGGQHVNKTDSAVRLTHLPTGTVVECQTQRSQITNKKTAWEILSQKLYAAKFEAQRAEISASHRLQVGERSRSEKIRTYNFPQDRLTDHRLPLTLYNLKDIIQGGAGLSQIIAGLERVEQLDTLDSIIQGVKSKSRKS